MITTRGVAGVLLVLTVAAAGQAKAQQKRETVAVIEVRTDREESKQKMEQAVRAGLEASGLQVVDLSETGRRAAAAGVRLCDSPSCLKDVARAARAGWLLRGRIDAVGRTYAVHLEMIDGATGEPLAVREDRCEICTEREAGETASAAAAALTAQARRGPTAPAPRATASVVPLTVTTPAREPEGSLWTSRGMGWSLVGTGLAAVAAGVAMVVMGEQGTCDTTRTGCPREGGTLAAGVALSTVGVAAVATGGWLVLRGSF